MERWGNESSKVIFDSLKSYFNQNEEQLDWSFIEVNTEFKDPAHITPCDTSLNHAFATWHQYNEGKNKVWRIAEIVHGGQALQPESDWQSTDAMAETDLFIFQDWGIDIRNLKYPGLVDLIQDKWLIFRTYPPLFEGGLWQDFHKGMGSKQILVLRADDLRKLNTSISKSLSWEQTLQDIINEIYFKRNISLHPLRSIEYIIISFGCTGTLLIHNPKIHETIHPEFRFFFDAMMIEGYWEKAHPGYLPGDLELLMALLSKEILYPKIGDDVHFDRAIRAHLLARRALVMHGWECGWEQPYFRCITRRTQQSLRSKTHCRFQARTSGLRHLPILIFQQSGIQAGLVSFRYDKMGSLCSCSPDSIARSHESLARLEYTHRKI
jgi:hypothetical protein